MERITALLLCLLIVFCFTGCSNPPSTSQIVATTLPVYNITQHLCDGTDLSVTRLITEDISCLHDYTLKVPQMRAIEGAETLIISGAGLESFLNDTGTGTAFVIDASRSIALICQDDHHADAEDPHHHHQEDPHIWLSPQNAKQMAENIYIGLTTAYPQYEPQLKNNLDTLNIKLDALQSYAREQLSDLNNRELITFHDGFAYMAQAFDLTILDTIQEEYGSETSAKELAALIDTVQSHDLPAVFTEINSSSTAASVISTECSIKTYPLSMAMSGDDYFNILYQNIDTLKEALG